MFCHTRSENLAAARAMVRPIGERRMGDQLLVYTLVHILIPRYRWEDILMLTFLIDRCAFFWSRILCKAVMLPGARFARQVLAEEVSHLDFGNNFVRSQAEKLGAKRCNVRSTNGGASRSTPLVRRSRSTHRNTSGLDLLSSP